MQETSRCRQCHMLLWNVMPSQNVWLYGPEHHTPHIHHQENLQPKSQKSTGYRPFHALNHIWALSTQQKETGETEGSYIKVVLKNRMWYTCDRQLRALNMSKNTKQVNVIVVSLGVIILSLIWNKTKIFYKCEAKNTFLHTLTSHVDRLLKTLQSAKCEPGSQRIITTHQRTNSFTSALKFSQWLHSVKSCQATTSHISWLEGSKFLGPSLSPPLASDRTLSLIQPVAHGTWLEQLNYHFSYISYASIS
jgi:hypothetical protein